MSLSQVSGCLSCQCGISLEMLLPHLAGVITETAGLEDGRLRIWAHSGTDEAACQRCGQFSARVHSRYRRRLADAPVGGHPVVLCSDGCFTGVCHDADILGALCGVTRAGSTEAQPATATA